MGRVNEEIILDVDLDGSHYLLIRLPKEDRPHVHLSPREQEIVRMVAKGHSNKIIADILNISSWTVCTHLRRIFAKLGVSSRAAMVAKTLEETRPWDQTSGEDVTTKTIVTSGSLQPGAHAGSGNKGVAVFSRSFSRRMNP
jgi:DNA-binding CsgD family transcriptional regulator